MFLQRIWAFVQGYVLILVQGQYLERFLNFSLAAGIRLWDVRRVGPDMLTCKVGVKGFKRLRPILAKTRCRARLKQRAGLIFLTGRALKRPVLFAGLAAFVCLAYLLSGFVWFVEIRGTRVLKQSELLSALRTAGVYPGSRKSAIYVRAVEDELVKKLSEVAWAGVRLRGTVAVVEVVEKEHPADVKDVAGSIVASRDGIIERLRVFEGYARVWEGQTVHAGDILIAGTPVTDSGGGGGPAVRANGVVEARVWYHSSATVLLKAALWRKTGKSVTVYQCRIGNHQFKLGRVPKYAASAISTHRRQWFPWRNGRHYVEIVSRRFDEVTQRRRVVGRAEAVQSAAARAREQVERQLAGEPIIRVLSRRQSLSEDAGKVTVSIIVEAFQDIGIADPQAKAQGR